MSEVLVSKIGSGTHGADWASRVLSGAAMYKGAVKKERCACRRERHLYTIGRLQLRIISLATSDDCGPNVHLKYLGCCCVLQQRKKLLFCSGKRVRGLSELTNTCVEEAPLERSVCCREDPGVAGKVHSASLTGARLLAAIMYGHTIAVNAD